MKTSASSIPYRMLSIEFTKAYFLTMRSYLLFVSGITGVVGMSFAPELSSLAAGLIFLASFFSYGFSQALTDCFQIDTDSLSAPYRPLTQGTISKQQVLLVSIAGLLFCIAVFMVYQPLNFFLGMLAAGGVLTYTPFKRKWWAGPFYNSWIVVVLCLIAFFAAMGSRYQAFTPAFMWMLLTVFFGYANFVLAGYFKDVSADAATGYYTFPVVFGKQKTAFVSDVFAMLTIISAALAIRCSVPAGGLLAAGIAPLLLAAGGILATIIAQWRLHRVQNDEDAHRAIAPVVHGYILLLAAITLFQKPAWAFPMLAFYAGFVFVLYNRAAKNQI